MNGLHVSDGVHAPPANPLSGFKTDLTIRGLLPEGAVLYVDVVTATVTCKSVAMLRWSTVRRWRRRRRRPPRRSANIATSLVS